MTADNVTTLLVGIMSATVALIAASLTQRRANRERMDAVSRAEKERDAALERLDRQLLAQKRDTATKEARSDERHRLDLSQSRTRLLTERFGRAAEQIGSSEPAVRLAGVYALAALADEWEEQRQRCVDVLCGYLRLPPSGRDGEGQVHSTIVRLICAHLTGRSEPDWSPLTFDFAGAYFLGPARFADVRLPSHVTFERATFHGEVDFSGTSFQGEGVFAAAEFEKEVTFAGARFSAGAVFENASFAKRADFSDADFSGEARFYRAELHGSAVFDGVTFRNDARFIHADFQETASFYRAEFRRNARFAEATFHRRAMFDASSFGEDAWFDRAVFRSEARFAWAKVAGVLSLEGARVDVPIDLGRVDAGTGAKAEFVLPDGTTSDRPAVVPTSGHR